MWFITFPSLESTAHTHTYLRSLTFTSPANNFIFLMVFLLLVIWVSVCVCFFLHSLLIHQYILLICYLCTEMKIIKRGQKCSVSNGKEMGLRLRNVWGIRSTSYFIIWRAKKPTRTHTNIQFACTVFKRDKCTTAVRIFCYVCVYKIFFSVNLWKTTWAKNRVIWTS